jgi:hypothetical protein
MTEAIRSLPGRAPGPRPATGQTAGVAAHRRVAPIAAPRAAVATRRPVPVVVAVGMTAGLYAISLAGVAMLQSASDLQLAADRAPAADAVAGLKSAHDAMEASLGTLSGAYAHAADGYKGIAKGIVGHEQALAALRQQVEAAAGSAAALSVPSLSRLPAVSGSAVTVRSRPVVNACTTASGKPC